MKPILLIISLVLLAACGANSGASAPTVTVTAAPVTVTAPPPSSSPPSGTPTAKALPNGWTENSAFITNLKRVVNSLNQSFPSANLKGTVYTSDGDPEAGGIIVLVGHELDGLQPDQMLNAFDTEKKKTYIDYTTCAEGSGGLRTCLS